MTIYLYVKQHKTTGLKYFGKTYREDPYKYKGSGSYWLKHIRKHGKDNIDTLHVWSFEDEESCSQFAIDYSKKNNIVESTAWANLIEENGLDGGRKGQKQHPNCSQKGRKRTEESKQRMREAALGRKQSPEHIAKRVKKVVGLKRTEEQKARMRGRRKTGETKTKQRITYEQRRAENPSFNTYWKGKKLPEVVKEKIRLSKLGKKHTVVTCPHCGKQGGQANMTRWHFNNCKGRT